MKRIGFVDYKLENFHANTYLALIRNQLKGRGFDVAGCWAMDAGDGKAWAAKNKVPYYDTPEALDAAVDYYVILAPSNPETHLDLCKTFFPFSKTTYVDKTFAPDIATAKKIFALADKHGVAMQTSSALRYTNVHAKVAEMGGVKAVRHMVTWGGGGSFGEYAIHAVELLISLMGPKATRLMRRGTGAQSQLIIDFDNGRTGIANVYVQANTPFAASITTEAGTELIPVDGSAIFHNMAAAILDLFQAGTPGIDRDESLMIRRILDAAEKPAALKGFVRLR